MTDFKKTDIRHWKSRLVHRKYTDLVDPRTAGHLSARIEHDGTGCYFPLGSDDETRAATRALEIYRRIEMKGWSEAYQRFVREFTVAIFWESNPLLCTYTTLLTAPAAAAHRPPCAGAEKNPLRLVIVESDHQVRQGLVNWTKHLGGWVCAGAFAQPGEARSKLSRPRADLILFNRSLPDLQATRAGGASQVSAEASSAFAFGIYETGDEIFISHTGVSNGYFLRRTAPAHLLEPLFGAGSEGLSDPQRVLLNARKYFQGLVGTPANRVGAREKSALTPREEEILLRLSKGYQDKQIADTLSISTWTVHNHIKSIFKKLGVHTRTQAVIKHLQK